MVETLEEIDNDEPVVVFCRFTHDIAQARLAVERTGRSTSELSGHVNELATWQAGMSDVLVVQLQSGSEGIDLTRARYCVFCPSTTRSGASLKRSRAFIGPGNPARCPTST